MKSKEDNTSAVKHKKYVKSADGFWSPPKNKQHKREGKHESTKNKRTLQLSPTKSDIELSNRFQALHPSSPLLTSHPMKKMALSASCSNLCQGAELEPLEMIPMGESPLLGTRIDNDEDAEPSAASFDKDKRYHSSALKSSSQQQHSSKTSSGSSRGSLNFRPTKLNRPKGSEKNSSLSKHGKAGSNGPRNK